MTNQPPPIPHATDLRLKMHLGSLTWAEAMTDLRSNWGLTETDAANMLDPDGYWRGTALIIAARDRPTQADV